MKGSFLISSWVLATQWDKESLQFVLAEKKGAELTIVAADSIEHDGDVSYLGEALGVELKKHGARRPTVLVALGRSQVDMFMLELPPATDDELATLVPLQTMQQAPEITEDAELDYLPLDDESNESRKVLAVVPHQGVLDETRMTLQAAGCTPSHVSFRPLATLPLARQLTSEAEHRTLTVTLHENEADILVIDGNMPRLTRSVRLPDRDDLLFMASLSSEIHRTEIAAPSSPGLADGFAPGHDLTTVDAAIECVYGFGGSDEHVIWDSLGDDMGRPVTSVDVFQFLPLRGKLLVRDQGRFASLVGLLHDYRAGEMTLDFLHPRRPAKAPSILRRYAILSITAVVCVVMAAYAVFERRREATEELQLLRGQLAQVERMADKVARRQRVISAINTWQSDDVNWLDELRDLSLRFPGPTDAVIQRMTVSPAAEGGNMIDLQVRVRDPAIVSMMEANLRDEHHSIRSKRVSDKRVSEGSDEDEFAWQFDASILVTPRQPEAYRRYLSLEKRPDN